MQAAFMSFYAVIALDLSLAAFVVGSTIYVILNWKGIRTAGAGQGVVLIMAGLWALVVGRIPDIGGLTTAAGRNAAKDFYEITAGSSGFSGWHFAILASLCMAVGLFSLVRKVVGQFEAQARMLEEALQREQLLNSAAQLAKLGFCIFDSKQKKLTYCTEQHAAAHGHTREEYLGWSSEELMSLPEVHPDDRQMMRDKFAEVRAGKTISMEYRVPTPKGVNRIREIVSPVFDVAGNVVREIGVTLDITEQRETELLLQQSIKMEAIGNLTGGIAHDFNNLLAVILGNLELAREVPEDLDDLLQEAISATLKGADLTKSMLSFARRAPLEPSVLDLNKIVLETKNWAARALPASIAVETSLLAGLWPIKADRASTESALLNLILNGRDAMAKGGQLTLETANVRIDKDYVDERNEDLVPGRYVMLAVSDTGMGIVPEVLDRIFDPFFSTKGPGKGSGLGLSMIQGFMKQSGGAVRVYSEPKVGTTFKLYFLAVSQPPAEQELATEYPAQEVAPFGKTILVAEDEASLMDMLAKTLNNAGYEVLAAHNGDTALARFKSAEKVDLVLTDIVMPGTLEGPALVKALRALDSDLPAVFMSGYANEATVHGNGLRPEDIRLMKPVGRQALLDAIEQALAMRRRPKK